MRKGILAFFIVGILSSCSSMLYYPDSKGYLYPGQFDIHPEEFRIKTEDGLELETWWIDPIEAPSTGVVVFFHGNAQNLTAQFPMASWLRHYRFSVLMFDYRGYGVSEGKPSPEGTVLDGIAALREGKRRADRLKVPLYVFGQSLGGAIALRSLTEVQKEFVPKAVILDSTFISYRKAANEVLARGWLTWPFQWLPYLVLSDEFAPVGSDQKPPLTRYWVVHGKRDQTVSFSLGERLFEWLPGSQKKFVAIENGVHTDAFFRKDRDYRKEAVDWLKGSGG